MPENCVVRIRKEALKFAAAHMTVFPDGTKEAIHGHQYNPTLSVSFSPNAVTGNSMIPFSEFKKSMKAISDQWDEKLLLGKNSDRLKIILDTPKEIEFILCDKRYVIPRDEVELLPISNITCEELAMAYANELQTRIDFKEIGALAWSLEVEESPGQSATVHFRIEDRR